MANTDRPNGFTFAKSLFSAPVQGLLRKVPVASAADADIFIGSPLIVVNTEDGAEIAASGGSILGVAAGFGRNTPGTHNGGWPAPYDPSNLETRFFDASALTNSEWFIWYVPSMDGLFEIQTPSALTFEIGDTADFTAESGSATTGVSTIELAASSNVDLNIVERVEDPDNVETAAFGRYLVSFDVPVHAWG